MIEIPTVLVLGAGASKPYGFPLGGELVNKVWSPTVITKFGREEGFQQISADWQPFKTAIGNAQPLSVDDFLGERAEYEKIGRLCIAGALMPRESWAKAHMFGAGQEHHWYRRLWHLSQGPPAQESPSRASCHIT